MWEPRQFTVLDLDIEFQLLYLAVMEIADILPVERLHTPPGT
jgi:hypothetical protein